MINVVFPEIETKIAEEHSQKVSKIWFCIWTMFRVTIQGRQRWKFRIWDSQEFRIHHTVRISPFDFWFFGFVQEKSEGSEHRNNKGIMNVFLRFLQFLRFWLKSKEMTLL
jgi:hypothetical protein